MKKTYTNKIMPTIRDVAIKANVSVATVSRAINKPTALKPETLKKVHQAMKALGYTPNIIARSLKMKRSSMVGIIIPNILNIFFAQIIRGAEKVFSDFNLTTVIFDSEENSFKESRYLHEILERRFDGLIIVPSKENTEIPRIIKEKQFPVVFADRYFSNEYDSIKGNNFSGISLLVSHLVSRGYKKIGAIAGPLETLPGRERHTAFLESMSNHGLEVKDEYIKITNFSIEDGYRKMKNLLTLEDLPEAVVMANNFLGVGALRAIKEGGLKIPHDIAIAVFDEVYLADLTDPPLTVVVQPAEEIGKVAANMLIERINGDISTPPREIILEPMLIVRRSTK
jgi:DNA-binding LacI/PurR family transcriptional regulator